MAQNNLQDALPTVCKAGCVVNSGPDFSVVVDEVAVPQPGPDQLLIRLNATGLCHSDIAYMSGSVGTKMDRFGVRSPGHEGVGVVVKVGSDVQNWKVGDRGGVRPLWNVCGKCELCSNKLEMYCPKVVPTGLAVPGTYQQYILSPASYTARVPDGVDDNTAAPIMCSGTTAYRSLSVASLKPGDWAVFTGAAGGVGHFGIQLAATMGLRVIAIDSGEKKRALCKSLGFDIFLDYKEEKDLGAEVKKITGGQGAHAVFVTAGSAQSYASAPKMLRVGGKIMCIGHPPPGSDTSGLDPNLLIFRNLQVIGTMIGTLTDTHKVLEIAAQGKLKAVYEAYSIDELPQALQKLRNDEVAGRCVVDFNS